MICYFGDTDLLVRSVAAIAYCLPNLFPQNDGLVAAVQLPSTPQNWKKNKKHKRNIEPKDEQVLKKMDK